MSLPGVGGRGGDGIEVVVGVENDESSPGAEPGDEGGDPPQVLLQADPALLPDDILGTFPLDADRPGIQRHDALHHRVEPHLVPAVQRPEIGGEDRCFPA